MTTKAEIYKKLFEDLENKGIRLSSAATKGIKNNLNQVIDDVDLTSLKTDDIALGISSHIINYSNGISIKTLQNIPKEVFKDIESTLARYPKVARSQEQTGQGHAAPSSTPARPAQPSRGGQIPPSPNDTKFWSPRDPAPYAAAGKRTPSPPPETDAQRNARLAKIRADLAAQFGPSGGGKPSARNTPPAESKPSRYSATTSVEEQARKEAEAFKTAREKEEKDKNDPEYQEYERELKEKIAQQKREDEARRKQEADDDAKRTIKPHNKSPQEITEETRMKTTLYDKAAELVDKEGKSNIEAIKEAYKKLLIASHPDKGGSNEALRAIREVYKNIMNDDKTAFKNPREFTLHQAQRTARPAQAHAAPGSYTRHPGRPGSGAGHGR